jgi:probable rRNA maturation factor
MSKNIHFFNEGIKYTLRGKAVIRKWIADTVEEEKSGTGEICIVFCSDDYLARMNRKYLNHRTLTDIITFPMMDDEHIIGGDIFISIPRVRENAAEFGVRMNHEVHRVIIHGVLHLLGYDDSTDDERAGMRLKENYYLGKLA